MITTLLPRVLNGSSMSYNVTVGNSGSDYGWKDGSYGSIDPSVLDVNSMEVTSFTCEGGSSDFTMELDTDFFILPKNSYRAIMVEAYGDGSRIVLPTSDASFTAWIGYARWRWGSGSNPVWDSGELTDVVSVRLLL